jgi:hypothetical protein
MKILSFFRKPKPMEIKPMSVEIKPSALRAVDAYKKLQAAHAAAAARILEQDRAITGLLAKLAEAKAILDEVFPDNGGSMGGITE